MTEVRSFRFTTVVLLGALAFTGSAFGQLKMPSAAPVKRSPDGQASLPAAVERTPEQIDRFEATMAGTPAQRNVAFRPTIPMNQYLALKSSLSASPAAAKPGINAAPQQGHGILGHTGFLGGIQTDNSSVGQPLWYPPDAAGAIGATQFVQTLNNYMNVYSKAGALLKHISMNALMGSACNTSSGAGCTFDPRVQFDPLWQRWVVTADSFDDGAGHQNFWIAVSKTASATGAWWVYLVNTYGITGGTGVNFWDYPSVGMDQDGLIFTANVFSNSTNAYQGAWLFSLSKAQAYNGFTQSFRYFSGYASTLTPPMVQKNDLDGYAWIAMAYPQGNTNYLLRLEGSSTPNAEFLVSYYQVGGTTSYTYPPLAPQTCGSVSSGYGIDTLDARFQNAGTQVGDRYYQAQAVGFSGNPFPFVRYYVISGLLSSSPTVAEQGTFYSSGSSYDFNPSIAADASGELVVGWSATDPGAGLNSEVRYVGKQSGDPVLSGAVGASLFNDTSCLAGNYQNGIQRWGDYSQVSVDPKTAKTFWVHNEKIFNTSYWGTAFGKVHF